MNVRKKHIALEANCAACGTSAFTGIQDFCQDAKLVFCQRNYSYGHYSSQISSLYALPHTHRDRNQLFTRSWRISQYLLNLHIVYFMGSFCSTVNPQVSRRLQDKS